MGSPALGINVYEPVGGTGGAEVAATNVVRQAGSTMNRVGYFLRRPALLLSLLFILLVVMSALFAPWLTPFDPD